MKMLQIMIIVTGNFGAFNYLTMIAALSWLQNDDYPQIVVDAVSRFVNIGVAFDFSLSSNVC